MDDVGRLFKAGHVQTWKDEAIYTKYIEEVYLRHAYISKFTFYADELSSGNKFKPSIAFL